MDRDAGRLHAGLRASGLLVLPLAVAQDGAGLALPGKWEAAYSVLRQVGATSLSAARLFEGHLNAVALVERFGSDSQASRLAAAVHAGALSGVWGADDAQGLTLQRTGSGFTLQGRKILASGAGLVDPAIVTTRTDQGGPRMLLVDGIDAARVDLAGWTPLGMHGSATGTVDLTGLFITDENIVGVAGDFLRQPHFSGGAWRFCAAHLGAMERLVDLYRAHLVARGRDQDPYQLERIAACTVATTTAAFWIKDAARRLGQSEPDPRTAVAFANLTRTVTERAALDVMEAVQRGIGLASFVAPHAAERILRDLATYLRQPVPDLAMADAARTVMASPRATRDLWA